MPVAWLCDFDGTVSPEDVGAAFATRFGGAGADTDADLEQWTAGAIGHRELSERQCRRLAVDEAQALQFVRRFELDPHFAPFVREVTGRGDAVMVVSEGFDFYLAELLGREGLGAVPRAANRLRFEPDGTVRAEFPYAAASCGRCGNCKAAHVRAFRDRGYETVLVGDGLSDRCGAREADRVFARGALRAWCRAEGVAAEPFEDFADVAAAARRDAARHP